jgi:transposase InsO family protein
MSNLIVSNSSLEQFYEKLDEYIWWYNNKRIKMGLGGLSPIEYRESFLRVAA